MNLYGGNHTFSLSLRHQLRRTGIKVFEVIPPTVDIDLDRGTISITQVQRLRSASPQEAEQIFQRMNGNW